MGFDGRSNSHYLFSISSPSKKSPQHHLLMSYGRLFCLSLPPPIFFSALFIPPDCGRRCRLAKINGQRFGGVILERRKEGSVYEALPRHSGVGMKFKTHF